MTTMTPDEIGQQINYRMSQATTLAVDVPGWLDPLPAELADAADDVQDAWSRLCDLEDDLQAALATLNAADSQDAAAIRDAARAGKPLPKPVDREELRRQVAYAYERVLPLFAEHSAANGRLRRAIDDNHRLIVTAAITASRAHQAAYSAKVAEARQLATEAEHEFGLATSVLNYVAGLPPVRDNVQFTAGGDGQVRVAAAADAVSYLAGTCAMLTERGLTVEQPA